MSNKINFHTRYINRIKNKSTLVFIAFLFVFLSTPLYAASLNDISFSSLPGNQIQVTFKFSENAPDPKSFTVDEPARLAFDFPQTKNKLSWRTRRIGMGNIKSITAIEASSRTRVVINLVSQASYTTRTKGDKFIVVLDGNRDAKTATASQTSTAFDAPVSRGIEHIDFRRGDTGEGRIVVTLTDSSVVADIKEEAGKILVNYQNATLPKNLQQSMNVIDFATPVKTIDTFQDGDDIQMIISPTGDYEHLSYQSDKTLTIDIKPLTPAQKASIKKTQYAGEKLSLNFQDIEVRAVLQLLADFTGLNVVVSDSVQGSITLRLKNTPWDQALDIILKAKGLAMRKNGSVMLVAPGDEIAAREKLELESQKQLAELSPLRSELIQINYAKAGEISNIIKSDANTLLSERGNVTVDERTNILLIRDTIDRLSEIRKLIASLDIPIRQVLIESRIVIANDGFTRGLGTRIGVRGRQQSGGNTFLTAGRASGLDLGPTSANSTTPGRHSVLGDTLADEDKDFNINFPLPTATSPGSFAIGLLTNTALLDLELTALQTEGKGEVVSNPRLITSNQKEASIEQGTEIPYAQSSSSGASTVAFKKAVLSLTVTPQITPDDRVILDLHVTKDSVGETFNDVPSIDTREIQTQVLVDNGETVVLGGIFEQIKSKEVSKVPLLGDIPLLGWLFRSTNVVDQKEELLIFITPKILKDRMKLE